jgi:carbon storage regulator
MDENRFADHGEVLPSERRGGVHAMAEVIEELREQYPAPFLQRPPAVPEEEALAVWVAYVNKPRIQGGSPMLVLSRRKDEQIVIDGRIVVRVVQIRGGRVRLGIEAPPEIPVHREEIQRSLRHNRPSAAWPALGFVTRVVVRSAKKMQTPVRGANSDCPGDLWDGAWQPRRAPARGEGDVLLFRLPVSGRRGHARERS